MTHPITTKVEAHYNAEDLGVSEGLLVAVARLLDPLTEGETLEVLTENPSVADDLRVWCRRAGHRFLNATRENGKSIILIQRGFVRRTLADPPEWGVRMPRRGDTIDMRDWQIGRHATIAEEAPMSGALAPRGASLEEGGPAIEFSIRRRSDIWANAISELYEQATLESDIDLSWSGIAKFKEADETSDAG